MRGSTTKYTKRIKKKKHSKFNTTAIILYCIIFLVWISISLYFLIKGTNESKTSSSQSSVSTTTISSHTSSSQHLSGSQSEKSQLFTYENGVVTIQLKWVSSKCTSTELHTVQLYINKEAFTEQEQQHICNDSLFICTKAVTLRRQLFMFNKATNDFISGLKKSAPLYGDVVYGFIRIRQLILLAKGFNLSNEYFRSDAIQFWSIEQINIELLALKQFVLTPILTFMKMHENVLERTSKEKNDLVYNFNNYNNTVNFTEYKLLTKFVDVMLQFVFVLTNNEFVKTIDRLKGKYYTLSTTDDARYVWILTSVPILLAILNKDATEIKISEVLNDERLKIMFNKEKYKGKEKEFDRLMEQVRLSYKLLMNKLLNAKGIYVLKEIEMSLEEFFKQISEVGKLMY